MNAFAKTLKDTFSRLGLTAKPLQEPEAVYGKARPMTGLKLSPEKRKLAAAYKGSINHGSAVYAKTSTSVSTE